MVAVSPVAKALRPGSVVSRPRLVLLGPGLANLQAMRSLGAVADLTLISEGTRHTYSGMLPGVLAGQHSAQSATIDLQALATKTGSELFQAGALRVDAAASVVELKDGVRVPYDFLSINIGAGLRGDGLPGIREEATLIKPLALAPARLFAALPPLVVAGGGLGALELAIVLHWRTGGPTTLVSAGAGGLASNMVTAAREELAAAGVTLRAPARVVAAEPGFAVLDDGTRLPMATLVWAPGPRAPELLAQSGLGVDDEGYLRVDATLRSLSHSNIFGAGDCVSVEGFPDLPKSGVFSIRAGPTLVANLGAALRGEHVVKEFKPPVQPLQLMNLGDGRALGTWKGRVFRGRAAMHFKEWIDRRWISQYPVTAS